MIAALVPALAVLAPPSSPAAAATACPAGGCAVTVDVRDYATARDNPAGGQLANFNYIVNVDNTKLPTDPLALSTREQQPPRGDRRPEPPDRQPAGWRYLISARSLNHKMWGTYVTVPNPATADGSLTARIDLTEQSGDPPAPARQDPGLRLRRQRLDQRRPGHRRGRPTGFQGRAAGADPQ
jgi:hypothetical protein